MRGCVGAVDGLLLRTNAPRSREVGNVQSYYSGHYKSHGANCQALADHRCRFIYMSIKCPGGTNDARAYKNTTLPTLVEDLPIGKFIVGDAAYTVGEHLLTPFAGASRSEKKKDTYNYYLSQCRIRIEMAFGRCINMWRFFKTKSSVLVLNLVKCFYVLQFCIITALRNTLKNTDLIHMMMEHLLYLRSIINNQE